MWLWTNKGLAPTGCSAPVDPAVDWKLETGAYAWGQVNEFSFRGVRIDPQKPDILFRIAVVGGSGGFDLYMPDDNTSSRRLEKRLHQAGFPLVQVVNAACPGNSSRQVLRLRKSKMLDWHPDLVVLYELYNDICDV